MFNCPLDVSMIFKKSPEPDNGPSSLEDFVDEATPPFLEEGVIDSFYVSLLRRCLRTGLLPGLSSLGTS